MFQSREVSIETVSSGAQTPNSLSARYLHRIVNCKKNLANTLSSNKEI